MDIHKFLLIWSIISLGLVLMFLTAGTVPIGLGLGAGTFHALAGAYAAKRLGCF